MIKRILFFGYGVFSYLIFLGTFLYAIAFIGNFGVPTTLDGPASGPLAVSLAIDVGVVDEDCSEADRARDLCTFLESCFDPVVCVVAAAGRCGLVR